jgi:hypothetical protein
LKNIHLNYHSVEETYIFKVLSVNVIVAEGDIVGSAITPFSDTIT